MIPEPDINYPGADLEHAPPALKPMDFFVIFKIHRIIIPSTSIMRILLLPFLFITHLACAQSFDELRASASANLKKKDYCAALTDLKAAFTKKSALTAYDYLSGVSAAANCNDTSLALKWLKASYDGGLGKDQSEIAYLENNESFKPLAATAAFQDILKRMKDRLAAKEKQQQEAADAWKKAIVRHQVPAGTPFQQAPEGFALYFTEAEGQQVPYVVYIPKGYDPSKRYPAIVYLHGGVNAVSDYYFNNPDVGKEPIFGVGEQFHSIIIYPFAKKDFGWVNQQKAFENIFNVVKSVRERYNVDSARMFLGGMSNGGSATFWFASQPGTPFRAFYAFAASPMLKIGEITFSNITAAHPLYTIHSKEDQTYKYEEVLKIYNEQKDKAPGWKFETIEKGSHGFIYEPGIGPAVLSSFFSRLLK